MTGARQQTKCEEDRRWSGADESVEEKRWCKKRSKKWRKKEKRSEKRRQRVRNDTDMNVVNVFKSLIEKRNGLNVYLS